MQTFVLFTHAVAWLALAILFIRVSRVAREVELKLKERGKHGNGSKRTTEVEVDY